MRLWKLGAALALAAYVGSGAPNASAQDWDSECPRWGPQGGNLQNEWQEPDGSWTGLYLWFPGGGQGPVYYTVNPCNP
jgi:hypothetical protein